MTDIVEIWRNIKYGFPEFSKYEISNTGRVKNLAGKILKSKINGGYLSIGLYRDDGVMKSFSLHRLVLKTFKPETYFEEAHVHHINHNPLDNNLENLIFITQKMNNQERRQAVKMSSGQPVEQFSLDGKPIAVFGSLADASRATGILAANISGALFGRRGVKQAGGFVWKRIPIPDLQGEIWKTIHFNGVDVKISNMGRIKNWFGVPSFGHKNKAGYAQTRVGDKTTLVHKIVAIAFCKKLSTEQDTVDHVNKNKSDNRVENLRWVSGAQNTVLSSAIPIVCWVIKTGQIERYESGNDAARKLNIEESGIFSVLSGQSASISGRVFKYEKDYLENPAFEFSDLRTKEFEKRKIVAKNIINNKVIEFKTIEEAGKVLGLKRSQISSAIRGKKNPIQNYLISLI